MKNLVCNVVGLVNKTKENFNKIISDERGEASMIGIVLSIVIIVVLFAFVAMPQTRSLLTNMFADLLAWYGGLNIFPNS